MGISLAFLAGWAFHFWQKNRSSGKSLEDATECQAALLDCIQERSFNEVYTFDAETLKVTDANLAGRLNLGYTMEELREMSLEDLLPVFAWESVVQHPILTESDRQTGWVKRDCN